MNFHLTPHNSFGVLEKSLNSYNPGRKPAAIASGPKVHYQNSMKLIVFNSLYCRAGFKSNFICTNILHAPEEKQSLDFRCNLTFTLERRTIGSEANIHIVNARYRLFWKPRLKMRVSSKYSILIFASFFQIPMVFTFRLVCRILRNFLLAQRSSRGGPPWYIEGAREVNRNF